MRDTWDWGRISIPTGGGNPNRVRIRITMTAAITALFAGVNFRR